MTMKSLVLSLGICLSLASCTSNQIQVNAAPRVSAQQIASYQTWAWSPERALTVRDPNRDTANARAALESAIASSMAQKGFQPGGANSSDLLVHYGAGSMQRVTVQNVARPNRGTSSRFDYSTDPLVPTGVRKTDWEEGRLIIQLLDRKTGQVVFSGYATAALLNDPSPSRAQSRIQTAVRDIFRQLPR